MEPRRFLDGLSATTTTARPTATPPVAANGHNCAGFDLPVGGVLTLPDGEVVTLTAAAFFKPVCAHVTLPLVLANSGSGSGAAVGAPQESMPGADGPTYSDFVDPFYASTFPQCYALAATTIVAYTLVIMLFITPRSFLDGGVVVLGRRGFTNGGTGPSIGGRPWLQKVAALSVAVSLTIASANTFRAAEEQYSFGIENAKKLQMDVLGGNELKIIRVISNTFLWLAQAQTLIRLFPRQREKVIIKWTAFALITLDVIFQCLNSFQYTDQGATRPSTFQDAVPALSYLFALSLGALYAAWVIYYSLMKKRYAFWHPKMKNMCLVATLSLLALLVPVVFFILDICKPDFTAWGEYVRWVGAAAASVIVWEWVERIEALEREEKKDEVLGREVFDGDEMLEMTPTAGALRRRKKGNGRADKKPSTEGGDDERPDAGRSNNIWPYVTSITARYRSRSRSRKPSNPADPSNTQSSNHDRIRSLQPPLWPARPAPAVTPVSRTDTPSAASTVYAVRYHALAETSPRTASPPAQNNVALSRSNSTSTSSSRASGHDDDDGDRNTSEAGDAPPPPSPHTTATTPAGGGPSPTRQGLVPSVASGWRRALAQRMPSFSSFHNGSARRRGRRGLDEESAAVPPPEESSRVVRDAGSDGGCGGGGGGGGKWDLRTRMEEFAATQAERLREKFRPTPDTDSLPVTVIPAPPRPGAALAQLLEEEERERERERERVREQRLAAAAAGDQGSGSGSGSGSASGTLSPRHPVVLLHPIVTRRSGSGSGPGPPASGASFSASAETAWVSDAVAGPVRDPHGDGPDRRGSGSRRGGMLS